MVLLTTVIMLHLTYPGLTNFKTGNNNIYFLLFMSINSDNTYK